MQADYISNNQFKVSTDKTEEFLAGRRVRANCDGTYIYSTIQSSTYSDPDTTVTIEENVLTSGLSEVHYGIVNIGEQGSFPKHSHDGDEGTGGGLSLLTLEDTPSSYEEGKYLRSTTSGVEFEDLGDIYYTESEVDTISGSLQTNIDGKSDTAHLHDDRYYTETEVDDLITTISGKLDDHNELNNLDYASAGHTGFQPAGDYVTDSELTSVSGILQTDIDTKPDTEVFLSEGVPSNSIGGLNDIAINQEIGTVYKKTPGMDSATFYPAVSGDDVLVKDNGDFYSNLWLAVGEQNAVQTWDSSVRFPNVTIPNGATITSAYIKFTAHSNQSGTVCKTNCYFNDVDNAVAPTDASEYNALVVTSPVAWDGIGAWTNGTQYDTPDLKTILQTVINRGGWASGQAVQFLIKDNGSDNNARREMSSIDDASGTEKPELHVAWSGATLWDEKLSPDFLKLSDTPTTYAGLSGQYLKTTNSGIEFVEDLYTKSEVNTISGTLQAELDTKANIEWFLVEGAPAQPLGKKDDIAVNQETGNMYEKILDAPVTATWNPSDKSTGITLSNGNLTAVSTTEANKNVRSTLGKSSGKWYWEYTIDYVDGFTTRAWIGVGTSEAALGTILGYDIYGYSYFNASGNKANNGASVAYGDAFVTNDVIGIALDLDNGKIWWSRNGVWQASGDPAAGTNEAYSGLSDTFYAMVTLSDTDSQVTTNFGASSFSYSAPSGFTSGLLVGDVWEERLTPDFLKLSDTPTTYSGSDGKYLKTTTSGIDFVEDLYTKSEVDTISGTLQTDIDGKADTVHIHDDRYYTESEVDTISGTLQTSIDSMPVTLLELADTPTTYSGSVGEYLKTTSSGVIFSDIDSEYWESVDVFLDENYSNDKGLPTQVERGLFKGYSMPIWATPANQYEELVFRIRVPFRWDGVTNPTFMILVSTSATEDVGDKFKFQMEWESKGVSNVIPDTTAETLTDEVPVTDGTAYYSYLASASLDATKLISGDNLQFRVRRVTATDPQVSNEIIIWHWDSRWKMNKLGTVSE